ncbi:MAG: hypothetical protein IV100_04020 [Myxococcales bacterium]|nr:hypothetical protein [Myxococcales bacterium]
MNHANHAAARSHATTAGAARGMMGPESSSSSARELRTMGYEAGRSALSPAPTGDAIGAHAVDASEVRASSVPTREESGAREVIELRSAIRAASAQYGIPETWIGCIIMHESQSTERQILGDIGERAQANIQGSSASIGVGQMQVGVAERLRNADPRLRGGSTIDDLLNADRAALYIAAYLAEILRKMRLWLTRMGEALEPDLERDMVLLGYNIGFEALRDRNLSDASFGVTYADRARTIRSRSQYIAHTSGHLQLVVRALQGIDPVRHRDDWT